MAWLYDYTRVEIRNAAGDWVDVTVYVRPNRVEVRSTRGRDTELDRTGVPGQLTMGLDNASGIFTPGLSTAPLQITLGMPVRVTDVIGYKSFRWFTGTFEMPDTVEDLEGVDNVIVVTAVDRKQLLDNGRTFISTLSEQVRYTGGSNLVAFWPLGEASTEVAAVGVQGTEPPLAYSTSDFVSVGSGVGPPGDELRVPVFVDAGVATPNSPMASGTWETANRINLTSTDTVTIAVWVRPDTAAAGITTVDLLKFSGTGDVFLGLDYTAVLPVWNAGAVIGGWGPIAGVAGPAGSVGSWTLVALRFGLRDLQDLWVGTATASLSFGGGAPGSAFFNTLQLSPLTHWSGLIGQVQIYLNGYTYAQHLEQLRQGFQGLAYQRTDERIATILRYASPTTAIPAALDEGATFMQQASLAGRKPGDLLDEAVATERGRLFVDPAGITRFHARTRAYNL